MESRESIKSPFQMRDWRVVHLNYINPIIHLDPNSEVQWEIEVNKNIECDEEHSLYTGTIHLEFKATISQENRVLEFSGVMLALFTYDSKINEENNQKMNQLLQINGLTFCLGLLRNFISSQSDLLGIRKRLLFPSINLYNIRFDEKICIS